MLLKKQEANVFKHIQNDLPQEYKTKLKLLFFLIKITQSR